MEISGVKLEDLDVHEVGNWPRPIKRLMLFFISFAVIFLGYTLDLSGVWDQYIAVKQTRKNLQISFENAIEQSQNLQAYRNQVKTVSQVLETLTRQLPKTREEAGLLEDISSQASLTGLQFRSIKPLSEQSKGFYIENPIEINLFGTYPSLGQFVANISTLPRIVTVHDFVIKSDQKLPGRLDIILVAKTYWTGNASDTMIPTPGTPLPGNPPLNTGERFP